MSLETEVKALTQAINENTKVTGELLKLFKIQVEKAGKVSVSEAPKESEAPASDAKAGLAEKTETPARADAPEAAVAPTVTEPEPKKEEKAPEVFDADAEKAERSHVCQALFGVLRGKFGASDAKTKTAEVRNAFLGHPFQATGPMDHEQHVKFMAYMNKAIEEAK